MRMTGSQNQPDGAAKSRDRFIPVRKGDILDARTGRGGRRDHVAEQWHRFSRLLAAIYHYEYFERLETLRNDYYYFNPDLPSGAAIDPQMLAREHDELVATLIGVLGKADFVEVMPDDLARSHQERPALNVTIELPAEDYREVRFFRRGQHSATVEVAEWLGLRKRKVELEVYDHLVLMVMIKPAGELVSNRLARHLARNRLRPGAILIKYFRDIARGDVNMLFPDVRVVMSLFDKLALGLPAIAGGIPILFKLVPAVSVLAVLIATYLGAAGTVRGDATQQALAVVSALVALGGFVTHQWLKYQRQSLMYQKEISDNVYFHNIGNNAGVFDHIIGSAEKQEFKEALLAYYFLTTADMPVTQAELAGRVEEWLKAKFRVEVDFEVAEAVTKLERLALLRREGDKLAVPPLDQAIGILERTWAGFFPAGSDPNPPSS
jgi:hypothetical protein